MLSPMKRILTLTVMVLALGAFSSLPVSAVAKEKVLKVRVSMGDIESLGKCGIPRIIKFNIIKIVGRRNITGFFDCLYLRYAEIDLVTSPIWNLGDIYVRTMV